MSHTVDSIKMYVTIFAALLGLTFLTVTVAYVDLGALNVPVALAIAVLKAVLVLWFFMHLRHNDSLTKLFAVAGFFWLVILAALTFCDYFTRETPYSRPEVSWVRHEGNTLHFREKAAADVHHTADAHGQPQAHH